MYVGEFEVAELEVGGLANVELEVEKRELQDLKFESLKSEDLKLERWKSGHLECACPRSSQVVKLWTGLHGCYLGATKRFPICDGESHSNCCSPNVKSNSGMDMTNVIFEGEMMSHVCEINNRASPVILTSISS